jgi:aspartate kinase
VKSPVVVKFGGASLADPAEVARRIREIEAEGSRPVLVVSAREGVTDRLRKILDRPGHAAEHRRLVDEIERAHPELPASGRTELRRLAGLVRRLAEDGHAASASYRDRLLSQGERIAARWLASRLAVDGVAAVAVDSDRLGLTGDNRYGAARILIDPSIGPVRTGLERIARRDRIPVVTGYFGRSLEGAVATFGRGGSDYSATAIGAMIVARRVELVKRTVNILTADPRWVPRARPIERLSYDEAEELAQFGAKVLHPLAVEPARTHGIEIRVRSLERPPTETAIGPPTGPSRVRALSLLAPLRLLRIRVPGGREQRGVVAEISTELAAAGVNLVSLFTSSVLLSVIVQPEDVRPAEKALRPLTGAEGATLEGPFPIGLVTAIGDGVLPRLDRIPARLLSSVEGFSATPRSVSVAVPERRGPATLRTLHRLLVERGGR